MQKHSLLRQHSLSSRLLMGLGISMLVAGSAALGINYTLVRSHFELEEQEEVASIAQSVRLAVDQFIEPGESQVLKQLIQSYADLPDVVGVAIVDNQGQIQAIDTPSATHQQAIATQSRLIELIESTLRTRISTYYKTRIHNEPVLIYTLPLNEGVPNSVTQAGTSPGFVMVAIELEEMQQSSWAFLLTSSAILLVLMLTLLAKVGILLRASILKPLQQLTQAIQSSKDSRSFVLPSALPNNEIQFLASTFEVVFQALQQAEQALQERENKLHHQNQILSRLAQHQAIRYGNFRVATQEIIEATAQTLDVERVSVWLYNETKTHLDCYDLFKRTPNQHSSGLSLVVADYPAYFHAISTEEKSIAAHDAHTDLRTCEFSENYLTPLGIQSMLDAAIRLSGQTVGVLCIEHVNQIRYWQPEEESFARSIADIMALALEARDRKRAEAALLESETTNRALIEAIPDLLIRMKQDGTYLSVQNGGNIALINPDKVVPGNNIFNVLPRETAELRMRYVEEALRTHKIQVYEQQLNIAGNTQYEEVRITPCSKNEVLIMIRDISKRQQAENQIRRQAYELAKALQKLKVTQAQIVQSEKMSSLGQMVAGVAHEINNPINFIYGNISYADEYIQDLLKVVKLYQQHYPTPGPAIQEVIESIDLAFVSEDLLKLLSSMKFGAERIRGIVQSLRNFSRLDEAEFKAANVHEGIDSTLMLLHNRLMTKSEQAEIKIIKHYGDIPYIDCYPGQLNQVFMNILSNAIDAIEDYNQQCTPEARKAYSGYIQIRTELLDNQRIVIRIADNGLGMDEPTRTKLFDPFFTTKPVGKGSGLGLSISYQIVVEKHNGNLYCHSRPGQGSEFVIELPICQEVFETGLSNLAIAL